MNFQQTISQTLMRWLSRIDCVPKFYNSFYQLSDGVVFAIILSKANDAYFGQLLKHVNQDQTEPEDNFGLNLTRLKTIWEKIVFYFEMQGGHAKQVNLLALAKDKHFGQLLEFFGIVSRILLESDAKDEFIGPVLELGQEDQEIISEFFSSLLQQTPPVGMSPQQSANNSHQHEQQLLLKIDELEQEIQASTQKYASVQEELSKLQQTNEMLNIDLKDKNAQLKLMKSIQLQNPTQELEQQRKQDQESYRRGLLSLQKDIRDLEEQNHQLIDRCSQVDSLKSEYDALKKRLTAAQRWETKVEQMKDQHSNQLSKFHKDIDDRDATIQKLQEKNRDLFDQCQKERDKTLTTELQLQRLQNIEIEQQEKIKFLEREVQDLKSRMRAKRISTDFAIPNETSSRSESMIGPSSLSQDFNEIVQNLNQLRQQQSMDSIQYNMSQVEENHRKELEILNEKIKSLDSQLKQQQSLSQMAEDKFNNLTRRYSQLQQQHKTSPRVVEVKEDPSNAIKLQEQNEKLQTLLLQFTKRYNALKGEYLKMFDLLNAAQT